MPPGGVKIQITFNYSDGFGRTAQSKVQAEPDNTTPNLPRWVGTGTTIYNNKGKPVRQYEPFFSDTHQYGIEQHGISPTLFYDPLERVVATLHPNHTYEKVVFDPWRQETWDVNDTLHPEQQYNPQFPNVLPDYTFNPADDPDVGAYFNRLSQEEYLPTWYDLRMDPGKTLVEWPDNDPLTGTPIPENAAIRQSEKRAAEKAAQHAATPVIAHLDTLGRSFLTIADNGLDLDGAPQQYDTRVELDIEGNQRDVIDARGNTVMQYDYDMLGVVTHSTSMDAGERWMLNNVAGQPIRAWDSRGHQIRPTYDVLQRPTESWLSINGNPETLVVQTIYGESQQNPETHNLRGQVYQVRDGAGTVTNPNYDFKGNLLMGQRVLLQDYKRQVDWAISPVLESETFLTSTTYDALNRPITLTTPDQSIHRPTYNEANLLDKVEVNLRGAEQDGDLIWTPFVNDIDYDAKGQRERIEYGNGVETGYEYDQKTFRLVRLTTTRATQPQLLQELRYTYDPVGNITKISDDAQQTIFFDNAVVSPDTQYQYDALYRLTRAQGREHAGQLADIQRDHREFPRMNLPHANDPLAMRNYEEQYEYDEVGNILRMIHQANNGDWTRHYAYSLSSNRLAVTSLPGDNPLGPYSASYEYDAHGNMNKMPHLPLMRWDFADQLQATSQQMVSNGGTPEITYYVYDAGGERVRKVTESQATVGQTPTRKNERLYLGGFEVYHEYTGTETTLTLERETLHIMDDTKRIAMVETKTHDEGAPISSSTPRIRYQLNNHLGSASLELDEAAAVISYEEYHPYGTTSYHSVRSGVEVSLKRYRYTGKERDEETGLYYHGARYYACWLGRWTAADPVGLPEEMVSKDLASSLLESQINRLDKRLNNATSGKLKPYRFHSKALRATFSNPSRITAAAKDNVSNIRFKVDTNKGTLPNTKFGRLNLYTYVLNNPVLYNDPTGKEESLSIEKEGTLVTQASSIAKKILERIENKKPRFPAKHEVFINPLVYGQLQADWNAGRKDNKERARNILWNRVTEEYSVSDASVGTEEEVATIPKEDKGLLHTVGRYHIHSELAPDKDPAEYPVGLSDMDFYKAFYSKLPNAVLDYIDNTRKTRGLYLYGSERRGEDVKVKHTRKKKVIPIE